MVLGEETDRSPSDLTLDLREVSGKMVEEVTVRECSATTILSELVVLNSKDDLQQIPAKSGCYFIFSRQDATSPWLCRNIGTYHGSVRERLRQHCYAPKGTAPHSQKYEIHKSAEQWGVTYRLIEPNVLRYSVEEILIKAFKPRDNKKHNKVQSA